MRFQIYRVDHDGFEIGAFSGQARYDPGGDWSAPSCGPVKMLVNRGPVVYRDDAFRRGGRYPNLLCGLTVL